MQKNYVTAEVNLAHCQRSMRIFFRSFLEFFRASNLTFPSYLFDTQHESIVYHLMINLCDKIYVLLVIRKANQTLKKETEIFASPGQYHQWKCFTYISISEFLNWNYLLQFIGSSISVIYLIKLIRKNLIFISTSLLDP